MNAPDSGNSNPLSVRRSTRRVLPASAPLLAEVREESFPGRAIPRGRERFGDHRLGRDINLLESAMVIDAPYAADLDGVQRGWIDGYSSLRRIILGALDRFPDGAGVR